MRRAVSRNHTLNSYIGIDDGPFLPKKLGGSKAPLVAVGLEGSRLVSATGGWIAIDGTDGTEQAIQLLKRLGVPKCPILLAGVTFGGFNLIDPNELHRLFRVPTIVVVGSRPDNRAVKRALVKHFPDWSERWEIIRSLGPLRKVRTVRHENPIFYESFGCTPRAAREILVNCAVVARVPEPLRVAGLVAGGLFPLA
jgi:uncharacterized protein